MATRNVRKPTTKRTPKSTVAAAQPPQPGDRNALAAKIYRLQAAACEAGEPHPAFGGSVITQLLQGDMGEINAHDLAYLLKIGVTLQDVAACGPRLVL